MLLHSKDRIFFFFVGIAIGRLLAVFSLGRLKGLSGCLEQQIPLVLENCHD